MGRSMQEASRGEWSGAWKVAGAGPGPGGQSFAAQRGIAGAVRPTCVAGHLVLN